MKKCFKCGEVKSLADFYKHPKMSDGHVNKCKECNKADVRENRAKKLQYYRQYDVDRYANSPDRRAAAASRTRGWIERHPERRSAHHAVQSAVRGGKLSKPDACSACGSKGVIHGHHEDYDKPLDVVWLCPPCHSDAHKTV